MKKLLFAFAKTCHSVLPNYILMNLLRIFRKIPILRKLVKLFDPDNIRKNLIFDLPEKYIFLRRKDWSLVLNSRDHIGFKSFIKNEPFEMAIYNLVQKISTSGRSIIVDIGANIGSASVPACAHYGYQLLAIEASKSNLPLLARNVFNNELKAKILPYALVGEVQEDYI